jgi:hypothetical protein
VSGQLYKQMPVKRFSEARERSKAVLSGVANADITLMSWRHTQKGVLLLLDISNT